MSNNEDYLLVVHGSRNLQYRDNLNQLAHSTAEILQKRGFTGKLSTSYLELGQKSLSENIVDFAKICQKENHKIKILPLFLFSGTHVLDDIPTEINQAQQNLKDTSALQTLPHFGLSDDLRGLISKKYQKSPRAKKILICHGTRLKEGQKEAEKLAEKLTAHLAYWSINPDLNSVVEKLVNDGAEKISLFPYFLFAGKVTRALEEQYQQLKLKYPHLELEMFSPLGATQEIAEIIVNCLLKDNS